MVALLLGGCCVCSWVWAQVSHLAGGLGAVWWGDLPSQAGLWLLPAPRGLCGACRAPALCEAGLTETRGGQCGGF